MPRLIAVIFVVSIFAGCAYAPELPRMKEIVPTFYKADIRQGSVLEKAQVDALEIGMTKADVAALLGSPSIIDPFHKNQWHYINYSILHEKDDIYYHLKLIFENDILAQIDDAKTAMIPGLDKNANEETAENSNEDSSKDSTENLTKNATENSGENPAQNLNENLNEDSTKNPAENSSKNPARHANENLVENPEAGENPVENPAPANFLIH